jgi:hypothetical protein
MFENRQQRFSLGQVVATANAVATLDDASIRAALRRHAAADWGELDAHDLAANEAALRDGDRLLSVYRDERGTRFYVITEWDRSVTTVLLPEDY